MCQEISFSPSDSLKSYHIVTLKDGTVLKGKVMKHENRRIDFQDELLGNVNFRAKEVASMEKVEPQDFYLITLMNGTTLQGKILNHKEKEIEVETSTIGTIVVELSKIKTIKAITPANYKDGEYWFTTPVDAHYFVSPSSIPLHSGEVYFQNTMGLFNSFNVGITKNLSCIGGIVIPFATFIAPHIGFKITKGIYAAGGGMFSVRRGNTGKLYANLGYGTLTFGNRTSHFTAGAGYGYLTYEVRPYYGVLKNEAYITIITVSGMKRFSPKYALITENWFAVDEGFSFYSGGFRLMGEKNNWDFGIGSIGINQKFTTKNKNVIFPVTFLSYMRTF